MSTRAKVTMIVLLTVCMLALVSMGASAATKTATVNVKCTTGKPVPVSLTMDEVRNVIGVDFAANWDSLKVVDESGEPVPFQLDDVDLSGSVSRRDEIAFLATGPVKITVSDGAADKASFPAAFGTKTDDDGNTIIFSFDGTIEAKIGKYGTVDINRYKGEEHKYAKDLGMIRYAGFPYSTYWFDKNLDRHEEKTTFEEPVRTVKAAVLASGPARITAVAQTASDLFPGLRQNLTVSIYKTGEIRVANSIVTAGYSDLSKLFTMCGGVMADVEDAQHILPVFRWIDWAEELNMSPEEYWGQLGMIAKVDGAPYIAFADSRGPKPAWWGASYLFCSAERWRTNYSPKLGVGLAEALMELPEVPTDLADKIRAEGWHLEGEWRTGYFRWVPTEMVDVRQKNGIAVNITPDMAEGDWPLHAIPGYSMEHLNYYLLYEATDRAAAIRYLEARYQELGSVAVQ